MLYCGKPPKEKYKKTGENIKKHDLFYELNVFLAFLAKDPSGWFPKSRQGSQFVKFV